MRTGTGTMKLDKYKGLIDLYGVNSFIKNMHKALFACPICKSEFAVQCNLDGYRTAKS